jgi:Domain of unknown function (DUF4249)
MNRYKFTLFIFFISIAFSSCTKVIDLKLKDNSGQLVIEGNVTNVGGQQYITLSHNVAFTSPNTYPPDSGATVYVTDKRGKFVFTEQPPGTYSIIGLTGFAGTTYKMTVVTNGITYTASSLMPAQVNLDSITSKVNEFGSSNLREITVHFLDPPGVENQYRFIMYINGLQANDIFVINDEFADGRYIDYDLIGNDIKIHPGDVVTVEMQCIDKAIYTYWLTQMQQTDEGPGGVAPSNPPTNITPVSLGYFSAHTTQSITLIVK